MPLIKKDNVDKFRKKLDPYVYSTYLDFSSLYPTTMHVAAQTIGFDIVPVEPMKPPPYIKVFNIDI